MTDKTTTTAVPGPKRAPGNERYWQAAAESKLLLRRCTQCSQVHHYPRVQCPFCWGETEWLESSGKGEVYTFSEMARAQPPYVIAYVMLGEGVAMMTHLVDCDPASIRIGQQVQVVFRTAHDGSTVPMFKPAQEHA